MADNKFTEILNWRKKEHLRLKQKIGEVVVNISKFRSELFSL
jgi:hypothetical protein